MPTVPVRLTKDPIIEAVFEYRFRGAVPAVADVLQGAIYPKLGPRFPRVQRTPLATVPVGLLEQDPNLRYQPRLSLQGDQLNVFIGDRAFAIACPRPYIGWSDFRPLILELMGLVRGAKVVAETERFSLRYVNLLTGATPAEQFSLVHYNATLGRGGYKLNNFLTYTRTEFQKDGLINIVELGANSVAKTTKGESLTGLIVTVDTINLNPADFLDNPKPYVDKAHDIEKSVFFDVLTEEAVNKMGPVWE